MKTTSLSMAFPIIGMALPGVAPVIRSRGISWVSRATPEVSSSRVATFAAPVTRIARVDVSGIVSIDSWHLNIDIERIHAACLPRLGGRAVSMNTGNTGITGITGITGLPGAATLVMSAILIRGLAARIR